MAGSSGALTVEINGMRWLARVRTERPVRPSMNVGEPEGMPRNSLKHFEWWAGWGSHRGRSGPSGMGLVDVALPAYPQIYPRETVEQNGQ